MKKQAVNICAIASLLLIAGCGEPPKPVKVEAKDTKIAYVEDVTPKVEQKAPAPVIDESAKRAAYQAGYKSGHIVGVADRQRGNPRKGVIAFKMGKVHGKADYPDYASDYANGYHLGYNEGWHGE
ncbi:MAG: hypothetical protein H8E62_04655 [Planctomycetes bacterium]|nr:hypothetical protein [Planctomycetota bacterium]